MNLTERIIRHEGLRLKPYRCTSGKLTIGIGRNLEDNGISEAEAMLLLENDLKRVVHELTSNLPFYGNLEHERRHVLIDMGFNLGISRLLQFKKMLKALEAGNYSEAAKEMLNSKWAKQVGDRATELADVMRSGRWNDSIVYAK